MVILLSEYSRSNSSYNFSINNTQIGSSYRTNDCTTFCSVDDRCNQVWYVTIVNDTIFNEDITYLVGLIVTVESFKNDFRKDYPYYDYVCSVPPNPPIINNEINITFYVMISFFVLLIIIIFAVVILLIILYIKFIKINRRRYGVISP